LKKIFIASDHAGFKLKESIKKNFSTKFNVFDLGPKNLRKSVNYPDFAHKLCKKIKKEDVGILVCGSGMGMAMTANKHKNIRAALCYSVKNAKLSRLHNDANVITLGERLISKNLAFKCVNVFLSTKFEGGRHLKRVKKI
jgi:ribose 5-phosphate isomerase B